MKLEKKIISILSRKKIKISFAESCTGGLLSKKITSINGASKIFSLGIVCYSNKSKNKVLKIKEKFIKKYGAVSPEVCLLMVKNISKIAKTEMAISITGIAGPKGGSKRKPVGMVYIGIKKKNRIKIKKHVFKNKGRLYIQTKAVKAALNLILTFIK